LKFFETTPGAGPDRSLENVIEARNCGDAVSRAPVRWI
jgi:hypothetical protein